LRICVYGRYPAGFTFAVPRTGIRLGDRSFAVAGPQIWNSLPADLRLVGNMLALGEILCLAEAAAPSDSLVFGRRIQIYLLTYFT